MSKERSRAREARQEARRREVEAAADERARKAKRAAIREHVVLPRRTRRFGQLSTRALTQVAAVYLAVQAVFWALVPGLATRAALAVISLAFLLVLVRTRKRPAR